jgi:hypothetical protein
LLSHLLTELIKAVSHRPRGLVIFDASRSIGNPRRDLGATADERGRQAL